MRRVLAMAAAALPLPAIGQETSLPAIGQETARFEAAVLSDYRERGLSWSDGEAAAQVHVDAPVWRDFSLSASAATARGARRHGGADVAAAVRLGYGRDAGLLRLQGGITAHVFPGGRGAQDYAELDAGIGTLIGPLDLSLSARYAPSQTAIGGSNLHGRARARFGLPGSPVTLLGQVGHSTGHVDDGLRAQRLRPGGDYTDWLVGADYVLGPMVFSLAYSDTDIARRDVPMTADAGHYGARIVAGAHIVF